MAFDVRRISSLSGFRDWDPGFGREPSVLVRIVDEHRSDHSQRVCPVPGQQDRQRAKSAKPIVTGRSMFARLHAIAVVDSVQYIERSRY